MTLIIAADVQDHLILAGDHCAVLSRVSNAGEADSVLRNYRKVYPWKYGAVAGSGDVFLMAHFCRLFLLHERPGEPIDLLQIAREAKVARTRAGVPADRSTGNVFFTLPGTDGFELHGAFFREGTVEFEAITPISTRFSMREERVPDEAACKSFNSRLRPSFFFDDIEVFHRFHLDLLAGFFARQSARDHLVTPSFDVLMLDKRSGVVRFWRTSDSVKTLVSLGVDDGAAVHGFDAASVWQTEGCIDRPAGDCLRGP